jgi:hypothetical protein
VVASNYQTQYCSPRCKHAVNKRVARVRLGPCAEPDPRRPQRRRPAR